MRVTHEMLRRRFGYKLQNHSAVILVERLVSSLQNQVNNDLGCIESLIDAHSTFFFAYFHNSCIKQLFTWVDGWGRLHGFEGGVCEHYIPRIICISIQVCVALYIFGSDCKIER